MTPPPTADPVPAGQLSRARARAADSDRAAGQDGFAALELAVLSSFVIVMLLLVVGLGRVSHGRQLLDQAGAAAARAAALTNAPGQASTDARQAASDTLAQAGLACGQLQIDVDTGAFHPGGYVDVAVGCTADLAGLALAGLPGSVTLTSTSRSPLETYRDLSLGFVNSEAGLGTNPGLRK